MPVTEYYWDELSDNVLMEADETGDATAVYTNEPGVFGELVSQERGGVESFYHFDGQGSTRELTDASETVTDEYTYTAFGETVAQSGVTENPHKYVGRLGYYSASNTPLYVRARSLFPTTGRWLSQDPFRSRVGVLFAYIYAQNNSPNTVDPSGAIAMRIHIWAPPKDKQWKCGQDAANQFAFYLDVDSPCDGYFVQKVTVGCTKDPWCQNCPDASPATPDIVFWEAFEHSKTLMKDQSTALDTSSEEIKDGTCGLTTHVGEIRFYCKEDAPEIEQWFTTRAYNSLWCNIFPNLPSTGTPPRFWTKIPNAAKARGTRHSSFWWNCCGCEDEEFVEFTRCAAPRFEGKGQDCK